MQATYRLIAPSKSIIAELYFATTAAHSSVADIEGEEAVRTTAQTMALTPKVCLVGVIASLVLRPTFSGQLLRLRYRPLNLVFHRPQVPAHTNRHGPTARDRPVPAHEVVISDVQRNRRPMVLDLLQQRNFSVSPRFADAPGIWALAGAPRRLTGRPFDCGDVLAANPDLPMKPRD